VEDYDGVDAANAGFGVEIAAKAIDKL